MIAIETDLFKNFKSKVEQIAVSPIFFVGTGLSMRYFNAPSWEGLLREVRESWDRSFDYYLQAYKNGDSYELEKLAEQLCEMYYEKLSDKELEPNKDKIYYFKKRITQIIDHYMLSHIDTFDENHEIQEFRKTSPSAIITTNYDTFLETMFPDYDVYIGQQSLLSTNLGAVGEIYKIHGCVTDTNSLVITQSDYQNFELRELYLNAKLLTLFLEYPIIFLGYSLSDKNVLSILTSIIKMLPNEKVEELSKRIWFIRRNDTENDFMKVERINLGEGLFIDVETFYLKDFSILYNLLATSKIQKLPIKFLKYLKSNVYKLVSSQVYNPKLLNVNITDIHKINDFDNINNIIGLSFSTETKYKKDILTRRDIIEPLLYQSDCEYKESAIKFLVQQANTILPIHYFLNGFTKEAIEALVESVDTSGTLKETIKQRINTQQNYTVSIGVNNGYLFSQDIVSDLELNRENLNQFIAEYCTKNGVLLSSKNTVLKYFLLELLKHRLHELINTEIIITNRLSILQCITHLDIDFIKDNIEEIYKLLKTLDSQNYDADFRKAVCHIDQILYGDFS
ncbi:MAG: SIR2 family protein [Lysinibacillus fusiformis]|nr:SIR2 family protein [Staphylococcus epidermidis]MCT6927176.1 SIR2 family protein [Lysinibacillus fusiformis]MCT6931510.1 SIR2 family protein [Lysinibacillus fusiformis]